MLGRELCLVERKFIKRMQYKTIGVVHVGERLRFNYLKRALSLIPLGDSMRILDIGCGNGSHAVYLAQKHRDWIIVGLDIDAKKITNCTKIAQELSLNHLSFIHHNILTFDTPDSFDLTICFDALEHIENEKEFFAKAYMATRPGGFLVLHVPGEPRRSRIGFDRKLNKRWKRMDEVEFGHVRGGYSNEEMKGKLLAAGFQPLRIVNPAGIFGQIASDLYTLFELHSWMQIVLYAVNTSLIWLDGLQKNEKAYPLGAGVLAISKRI